MLEGVIHKYGYSDGKRGLEAEYVLRNGLLKIKIVGSNHWTDYITNFMAWPRIEINHGKVHRAWWAMATNFADHLYREFPAIQNYEIYIVGHSMGGAVAAIMADTLPPPAYVVIKAINAPKCGNREYRDWLYWNTTFTALHDKGDVVRHFPFFYAKYRGTREIGSTVPFWKAHNNLPLWWNDFLREGAR